MPINRREMLGAASSASGICGSTSSAATTRATIKAIAFDGFPIFDPRPIFALAEEMFPGRGVELSNVWRTRQAKQQPCRRAVETQTACDTGWLGNEQPDVEIEVGDCAKISFEHLAIA